MKYTCGVIATNNQPYMYVGNMLETLLLPATSADATIFVVGNYIMAR